MTATTFVENPADCWITTPDLIGMHTEQLWPQGIGADPFHDPSSLVKAATTLDIRKGDDAYRDMWWDPASVEDAPLTALVNGPYSRAGETAKRFAEQVHTTRGAQATNLGPAAPGSEYWKAYVWPNYDAIAWLGRWAFIAGRDMYDKKTGRLIARAGERVQGNRTEIALVYQVSELEYGGRPRSMSERAMYADRFREIFREYPVSVKPHRVVVAV